MHPARLKLDRRLEAFETVEAAIASADLGVFDGDETVDRIHRLLYPAFRVEVTYETADGLLGTDLETGHVLVDGLWDSNDHHLGQYVDSAADPHRVPFGEFDYGSAHGGFGRTILLEFQAPDEAAGAVLPDRFDELDLLSNPGSARVLTVAHTQSAV